MKVLEGEDDFGSVEASTFLTESNLITQVEEELTAVQEICDEVEGLGRLERVVQFHDKGVRDLLHDITLNLRVINLVGLDDEVLLECLDGVNLPSILLLGHVDLAKGATSDHLQQLEILNRELLISCRGQAIIENLAVTVLVTLTEGIRRGIETIPGLLARIIWHCGAITFTRIVLTRLHIICVASVVGFRTSCAHFNFLIKVQTERIYYI